MPFNVRRNKQPLCISGSQKVTVKLSSFPHPPLPPHQSTQISQWKGILSGPSCQREREREREREGGNTRRMSKSSYTRSACAMKKASAHATRGY